MHQSREDFLAERRTGIGGSDAAALFNLGYGCRRRLWYEKRGIEPDYPLPETAAMERGIKLEPVARAEYTERTGRRVRQTRIKRHPDHPFIMAHLDGTVFSQDGQPETAKPVPAEGTGWLELKTMNREVFARLRRDGWAEDHILQVQHSFLVTGRKWGAYAAFWADGWQMLDFDVVPDEKIMGEIKAACLRFWPTVENGPAPERLEPDDRRCQRCSWRRTCQGEALLELIACKEGAPKAAAREDLLPLVDKYVSARDLAKETGSLLEERRQALKKALGDETAITAGGHVVYYRPHDRVTVNSKKLKKEHPRIYAECAYASVVRPLKVYSY